MGVRRGATSGQGSRFGVFLLGVALTLVALVAAGWGYLRFGHPPVAVADASLPWEREITHLALHQRIGSQLKQPPFGISEDVYESGAKLYVAQCSFCHGLPGAPATVGANMFPHAPQLWKKHTRTAAVGVSDDPPGETFWKIDHGIRLSGMPAYNHILTPEQEWQITLLLNNADQTLPDPVQMLLRAPGASGKVTPAMWSNH